MQQQIVSIDLKGRIIDTDAHKTIKKCMSINES